ncbi:MAG: HAMP domain-containing protein [Peptostreptococcaceae bacterium]|nr:HAMP domain-containing protein [Peptostreptococcaceae bacterium]
MKKNKKGLWMKILLTIGVPVKPIKKLAIAADELALGNVDIESSGLSNDEISELTIVFEKMLENMSTTFENVSKKF